MKVYGAAITVSGHSAFGICKKTSKKRFARGHGRHGGHGEKCLIRKSRANCRPASSLIPYAIRNYKIAYHSSVAAVSPRLRAMSSLICFSYSLQRHSGRLCPLEAVRCQSPKTKKQRRGEFPAPKVQNRA